VAQQHADAMPSSETAWRVLGWAASIQGKLQLGLSAYEHACRIAPSDAGPRLEAFHIQWRLGQLEEARASAGSLRGMQHASSSTMGWTAFDEFLIAGLEGIDAADPTTLQSAQPDGIRAATNFLLGNAQQAAQEFAFWLASEETTDSGYYLTAAHASLAAATAATDPAQIEYWQATAIEHLMRAFASCRASDNSDSSNRQELSALRWLQWDPTVLATTWTEPLRPRLEAAQTEIADRIATLLVR